MPGALLLKTTNDGESAPTERMRIDSGGLLMLGTTTPGYGIYGDNFTIHDSGYCGMTIRSGNSSDTDIYFADDTTGAGRYAGNIRYSHANDRFDFATAGVHRMYILSDGTIGAGVTSTPGTVAAGSIVNGNANAGFFNNGYDGKFGTSSNHAVYLQVNGSTKFGIDTSGNVGIGTTSQDQKLVVSGSGETNAKLSGAASTVGGYFYLQNTDTTDGNSMVIEGADAQGQGTSQIQFRNVSHTNNEGSVSINTRPSGGSMTERMRVVSSGDLISLNDDNGVISRSTLSAGTSNTVFIGQYNASITSGTNCFKVFTNGNVQNTNNSYGQLSDIKLKENIVDANSQWSDIKTLKVRNWNFKEDTGYETQTQIGVIAQEIEEISPGLIYEVPDKDEDDNILETSTKAVKYSVLYMKAIKALQEAMERIETLEAEISTIKSALE